MEEEGSVPVGRVAPGRTSPKNRRPFYTSARRDRIATQWDPPRSGSDEGVVVAWVHVSSRPGPRTKKNLVK